MFIYWIIKHKIDNEMIHKMISTLDERSKYYIKLNKRWHQHGGITLLLFRLYYTSKKERICKVNKSRQNMNTFHARTNIQFDKKLISNLTKQGVNIHLDKL